MNPTLQSTLYYTLSTVAQTLAGAIGLLGAIVLFSLQAGARSIERSASQLSQVPHPELSTLYIRHLFTRRSYRELARRYGELLKSGSETSTDLLVYHSTLTWELQHEEAIRRSFWRAVLGSGVVVAFAIVSLAAVPELHPDALGDVILALAVAGALGCLVLYGVLLRVVIRSGPEEGNLDPPRAGR